MGSTGRIGRVLGDRSLRQVEGVLPANGRSVYIEEQGRAAGRLDERARRMVTALLLAPSSDTLRSFDATPVLPRDTLAGRSLDQPDAARPF